MNRIESDRMNRADWIESIELIESDRTRCTGRLNRKQNRKVGMIQIRIGLYRPCLEAISSFEKIIEIKSEYKSNYKSD